jgi:hypothetical protein
MGACGRKLTAELHNSSLEAARLKALLAGSLAGAPAARAPAAAPEPARIGGA